MRSNFFIFCTLTLSFLFCSCNKDTSIVGATASEASPYDRIDEIFTKTEINNFSLGENELELLVNEMYMELPIEKQLPILERFAALNSADLDRFNELAVKNNIIRAIEVDTILSDHLNELSTFSIQYYKEINAYSMRSLGKPLHRATGEEFAKIKKTVEQTSAFSYRSGCVDDGGGSNWRPKGGTNSVYGYSEQFVETVNSILCDVRVDYAYANRQKVIGANATGNYIIRVNGNGLYATVLPGETQLYVPYPHWSQAVPLHDIKLSY